VDKALTWRKDAVDLNPLAAVFPAVFAWPAIT
jgi:hypothetical protein